MNESSAGILVIAGVIGFFALIIYIVKKVNEKQRAKLMDVAQRLGLTYNAPAHWYQGWSITGAFNGAQVLIKTISRGSGKNQKTYTQVRTSFKQNLNAGLRIYREGMFSKIGAFFGAQDLKTGNEEFDQKFIIKGKDEALVMSLLQKTPVQMAITELFNNQKNIVIDDEGIVFEAYGVLTEEGQYRSVLEDLSRTMKALNK